MGYKEVLRTSEDSHYQLDVDKYIIFIIFLNFDLILSSVIKLPYIIVSGVQWAWVDFTVEKN